jgi:GTP1/Obg family GTP-binding protein
MTEDRLKMLLAALDSAEAEFADINEELERLLAGPRATTEAARNEQADRVLELQRRRDEAIQRLLRTKDAIKRGERMGPLQ